MASELLGRRHIAEVDPLQSREIGSSVAVRAKFESSSDQFRKAPCFVLFRSGTVGSSHAGLAIAGGIQARAPVARRTLWATDVRPSAHITSGSGAARNEGRARERCFASEHGRAFVDSYSALHSRLQRSHKTYTPDLNASSSAPVRILRALMWAEVPHAKRASAKAARPVNPAQNGKNGRSACRARFATAKPSETKQGPETDCSGSARRPQNHAAIRKLALRLAGWL